MERNVDVIFVRHAESEDNLKVKALCEVLLCLRHGKLPSFKQVVDTAKLLEYDIDSKLSPLGKRQLLDLKMILSSVNFWNEDINLIVHSPLLRASETCSTIVASQCSNKIICLEVLREITPFEQLSRSAVEGKLLKFEQWLQEQHEDIKQIVVVGHCQYFNSLLGMKTLMRNCDVWKSTVSFQVQLGTTSTCRIGKWATPQLLHRTALSQPHPIGRVIKGIPWVENIFGWGAEELDNDNANDEAKSETGGLQSDTVENDLDSDEPTCRICQVRESEAPGQRMLRPCLCTGSVSHVHLECLNRWRATSSNAYFTCSVCRYNYLIKRTLWAELLVWEPAVLGFAVLMVLAVCVFLGLIVSGVIYFFDLSWLDPLRKMLELMEVDAYWMRCLLTHRYQPGKDLPLRGGQDFNKVISAIYNSTNMGVSEKVREFIRLLRSPLPMRYFICHPTLTAALNVFLLGALPIGCLGFFGFFIGALQGLRGGVGAGGIAVQVGFVVVWFASLGLRALSRLSLVVGCAIATREVYSYLLVKARILSSWCGDLILEPHR